MQNTISERTTCWTLKQMGYSSRKPHRVPLLSAKNRTRRLCRIFSWHTLGPLLRIEHCLNTTAYRSIVADHVHPFMTTVFPSSDATSSRIMHHVTKLKSSQTGFLNMTMSSLYSNGLHSHQISIQESTFGMWWNGRFTSWMCSRQICSNCVMLLSIWTKISEECFQHLIEYMSLRIKAVLKAKVGPTWY